jgi:HAD superfamily phosphatase (TIGR01681 family)
MTDNKEIKCVVWDLDGTLWDGVLLEGDTVQLRSDIKNIIQTLDRRGILQSIASKNDHDAAMEKSATLSLMNTSFILRLIGMSSPCPWQRFRLISI